MAKIAVVGGHGQIAQLLTKQLAARGDQIISVIRNPEHEADVTANGGSPVIADFERLEMEDVAHYFTDVDVVVFAAGAGPGSTAARKRTVDYGASVLAARAAAEMNVPRFIQISAIGVDDELDPDADPVWNAYVEAKRDADTALRRTALGWTILRPGPLTNDPGTGLVRLAPEIPRGDIAGHGIPRADVAAVIVALIDAPEAVRVTWDLTGGAQPISAAVADAVAQIE